MDKWIEKAKEVKKLLASMAGMLALLIASGTLSGTALQIASGVVLVLTGTGVYAAKNKPQGGT